MADYSYEPDPSPEPLSYADGIEIFSVCRNIGSLLWSLKKTIREGGSTKADRFMILSRASRDLREAAEKLEGMLKDPPR